jgi:hypothetical protein
MNKSLEKKLIDEFPSYFPGIYGDPKKTCMAWGCDHGDGWFGILWNCCMKLREAGESNFRFLQIKEKFGLLRLYYSGGTKAEDIIREAEKESGKVCEHCGTTDGVTTDGSFWINTLCGGCRKK